MPTYPTYKLGEVAEIILGQSPESKSYNTKGEGLPFFQGKSEFTDWFPVPNKWCTEPKKIAEPLDILLSVRAPVGPTNVAKEKCCIGRGLAAIRYPECYKYVLYYLRSVSKHLESKATGTTFSSISGDVIRNLPIPLPPLPIQHQIVSRIESLFAELDKAVELLRTAQQQLKIYKQAVLKNAFEPKVNWRCVKVSDIGEVNLGRQRSPKNVSKNFPTKYIRAANITEEGLDLSDVFEMEFAPNEREKYYLKENDILVSEASGSASQVGKPAIWRNQIENCCFQNTVIRHRITKDNPEYVFWYYKNLYVNGFFSRIAGGVGINHLGANKFSNIEIYIPNDISEQQRIVKEIETRLSQAEAAEARIAEALQKTETLRQSILKKAFSGELI